MRYTTEGYEEERGSNVTLIYMALIMSTVVLVVVGLMFWINKPKSRTSADRAQKIQAAKAEDETAAMVESVNSLISGSTLTSNQLDIWTLPDTGREETTAVPNGKNGTVTNQTTGETVVEGKDKNQSDSTENMKAENLTQGKTEVYDMTQKETLKNSDAEDDEDTIKAKDGKHTLITYQDGSEEWVTINTALPANTYQASRFVYQNPEMKYYVDGKQASWFGVDISSRQGIIDFDKLKKAGCDYVMIRIGGRGYSSGQIVLDSSYKEYLNGAKNAGLGIGVYFYSQAVTKEEVREEVDTLLEVIKDYPIKYPVVFDMESVDGDMARIDALDMDTRTELARLFLSEVEKAGYTPMLYGNKEWLVTKLDMEKLKDYDVWLSQEADTPDYPYAFTMWQYKTDGTVSGISEKTGLNISFVDYSKSGR